MVEERGSEANFGGSEDLDLDRLMWEGVGSFHVGLSSGGQRWHPLL